MKTVSLIAEAGKNGAQVLGFPEVFTQEYSWAIWIDSVLGNVPFVHKHVNNSLVKESPEVEKIKKAVKQAGVLVVLEYSERASGIIYVAQVGLSPERVCTLAVPNLEPERR